MNVIQSIDGYIARQMQLRAKGRYDLAIVHDNFMTHPNYSRLALQDYKEIMQSIADSNLLESILRELSGNPDYTFEKVQTGLQVTSDYCICS